MAPIVPVAPPESAPAAGGDAAFRDAAHALVGRAGVRPGQSVLLVVPDRTRPIALAALLDAVGGALARAGVDTGDVRIAIASGSHAPAPGDVAASRLGPWASCARLLAHRPEEAVAEVGRTPAGTGVRVHPALLESDVVLCVGATGFHYFAGFGGGAKLLFPGLGARDSIAANHRRALGPWPPGGLAPGIEPGRLAGNPLAEDLADVAALLPEATHLTTWDGAPAGATWRTREEFVALTERFAAGRRVGPARGFAAVVASAGGYPRDVDVVQAHKALFHAALYAGDEAAIVLLAECEEGVGSKPLEGWLAIDSREAREERARTDYDLNAQTAVSLAAIAARCRVTWVGANVPPALEGLGITRVAAVAGDAIAAVRGAVDRARAAGGEAAVLPVATAVVPDASL